MMDSMVFVEAGAGERARSRLSAISSLGLQALLLSVIFVVPLLKVDPPPVLHIEARPVLTLPRVMELVMTHAASSPSVSAANSLEAPRTLPLVVPTHVPHGVTQDEEGRDPAPLVAHGACPACTGANSQALTDLLGPPAPVAVRPAPAARPVKISHMDEGLLVHRVQPVYPNIARLAGVQGTVVLQAMISRAGGIESLRALSGNPLLVPAALDAVRQWRYRPYTLNGAPIEVETQISVRFTMQR